MQHEAIVDAKAPTAGEIIDLMQSVISDGLDHPELWTIIPDLVQSHPDLFAELQDRLQIPDPRARLGLKLLFGMVSAAMGHVDQVIELMAPLAADFSQSALVQGALFYLHGEIDPENPKYQLVGKLCRTPFVQLDVLESSAHLCCSSWLRESVGNVASGDWQGVWNSPSAEAIRASIHDGSYRYCNKGACPVIQSNHLVPAERLRSENGFWQQVVDERLTAIPQTVNLAYDKTCNLACPSCRVERFAADDSLRARFDMIQQRSILPMLKNAKIVFITGSGDPFASKNFRRLIEQLTPEEYPDLRFQVMTNGMLFTPRQWENFPSLHGRVQYLRISIDAATGPTHELLRRGARWPVMLENMAFAGELNRQRQIGRLELAFTVQLENYREMGDAVDLAHRMGASGIHFGRITNWGTFTAAQYQEKAVFLPSHSEYEAFAAAMQDPRLKDPIVRLGDLSDFAVTPVAIAA